MLTVTVRDVIVASLALGPREELTVCSYTRISQPWYLGDTVVVIPSSR